MKRNFKIKISVFLLSFLMLFTLFTKYSVYAESIVKIEETSAIVSQIDPRFPSKKPTDRIFAQDRRIFKGYKGRGEIIIENDGASSAEVYINGKPVNINKGLTTKQRTVVFNIGKYTSNGENVIKVLNIKPKGASLNIHIPYPELIEGDEYETGKYGSVISLVYEAFLENK